jgi:hypothetical protein
MAIRASAEEIATAIAATKNGATKRNFLYVFISQSQPVVQSIQG